MDSSLAGSAWEAAYLEFESPVEERKKFCRRLRQLGAGGWHHESEIAELFCGRGNGLVALGGLGFDRVVGIDISSQLVARFERGRKVLVGDCRELPLRSETRDILIVQGGLHHLPRLPDDLAAVLAEAKRVLRPGGRLVVVEPWRTPYLSFVHVLSRLVVVRRLSRKADAFARMVALEGRVYVTWLASPRVVLQMLCEDLETELLRTAWGKLLFVGRKKDASRFTELRG